jgi:metal-responsive CopG/Arc/MetJ family transcriptional regulator
MVKHKVISVKVTGPLYEVVDKYLELDAHVSKSDFVRDAIREKIKNDALWLYENMLRPEAKPERETK